MSETSYRNAGYDKTLEEEPGYIIQGEEKKPLLGDIGRLG